MWSFPTSQPYWLSEVVGGRWGRSSHTLVPVPNAFKVPALCSPWSHTSAAGSTGLLLRIGLKERLGAEVHFNVPFLCVKAFSYVQQDYPWDRHRAEDPKLPLHASTCYPVKPILVFLPTHYPKPKQMWVQDSNALSKFSDHPTDSPSRFSANICFLKWIILQMNQRFTIFLQGCQTN